MLFREVAAVALLLLLGVVATAADVTSGERLRRDSYLDAYAASHGSSPAPPAGNGQYSAPNPAPVPVYPKPAPAPMYTDPMMMMMGGLDLPTILKVVTKLLLVKLIIKIIIVLCMALFMPKLEMPGGDRDTSRATGGSSASINELARFVLEGIETAAPKCKDGESCQSGRSIDFTKTLIKLFDYLFGSIDEERDVKKKKNCRKSACKQKKTPQ